ncbi:MAG: tetratricopeptide repeat protein [Candidatus Zixiibacteriota bacterium]
MSTLQSCLKVKVTFLLLFVLLCLFLVKSSPAQDYTLDEGKKLFDQEEYTQAKEVLLKVVQAEPKNPEVNFLLCKTFLYLGDHDNCVKYGEKAVKLNDSNSNYHLWLGRGYGIQAQKGSKIKAIFRAKKCKGEFEKAVALDSTNVNARLDLLQYLVGAPGIAGGDKDKAKKQAEIIPGMDSLYGAIGWAVYWGQLDDTVKIEHYLKIAVLLDTTYHHNATYLMGNFLMEQKRYAEAAQNYEELYRKYPLEINALYQIGRSYVIAQDSLDKAERCFKEYLKTTPKRNEPPLSGAHWRLGMIYDLQGKRELALSELNLAVSMDPKSKEYKKTLEEVKKRK